MRLARSSFKREIPKRACPPAKCRLAKLQALRRHRRIQGLLRKQVHRYRGSPEMAEQDGLMGRVAAGEKSCFALVLLSVLQVFRMQAALQFPGNRGAGVDDGDLV